VRIIVAEVIGILFPRDQVLNPLLKDAISDKAAIVRIAAARLHFQTNKTEKEAMKIILVELKSPDAQSRSMAVFCLEALGTSGKEAFQELVPLVKDPNLSVRNSTIGVLAKIGASPDEVLRILANCLHDETVRGTTIYTISSFGARAKNYLTEIETFINDPDKYIQIASRVGVAKIKGDYSEAIPFLLKMLDDEDSSGKGAAARELGNIGPIAKEALPILRKILPTLIEGGQDRIWVQDAIKKIESKMN
jgi:HEAT repeat protein